MADTGAPWNLPYPLATDLVRDGAQAIEDLAEATATGLSAAGSEGIGPNVVQAVKTNTFSTSSTTPVLVTDLEVDITPSSDTAKVLVIATINGVTTSDVRAGVRLFRDTTEIVSNSVASFRVAISLNQGASSGFNEQRSGVIVFLDDPQTTSPVNYNVKALVSSGTVQINLDNSVTASGTVSSITAIEVAA